MSAHGRRLVINASAATDEQRTQALATAQQMFSTAGVDALEAAAEDWYQRNPPTVLTGGLDAGKVELWRSVQAAVCDACGPQARLDIEIALPGGRPSTLRVVAADSSDHQRQRALEAALAVLPADRIVRTMGAYWQLEALDDQSDYVSTLPPGALDDSEALMAAEQAAQAICGPEARFEFD